MHVRARGFTLTEAIVVIAITGIVAAVVAVFIQRPVQGYFDTTRRAQLSDAADTALRRMTRDLRLALPNSVRLATDGNGRSYLEFLLTRGGGRYRAERTVVGAGNPLDFVAGSASFDFIGPLRPVAANDEIVVFNLGPGFAQADAYQNGNNNRAAAAGAAAGSVVLDAAKVFPFESPGKRFHVVEGPVSYVCDPAAGEIRRYWGYAIDAAQPQQAQLTAAPKPPNAVLVRDVSACSFVYAPNVLAQRNGVVSLSVTLTSVAPGGNESVWLFQQAHVSNVP
jgi:MSHA biogenesis protein MshO